VIGLFATEMDFGSEICEKRDLKKHFSLSVAVCGRNYANRIPRLRVGISVVAYANVTTRRLDYYVGITNREILVGFSR